MYRVSCTFNIIDKYADFSFLIFSEFRSKAFDPSQPETVVRSAKNKILIDNLPLAKSERFQLIGIRHYRLIPYHMVLFLASTR